MQNTCASLAEKKQKKYSTILYIGWAVFCVFALTAPLYSGRYYTNFIMLVFIYCILSVGFNVASGFCGLTTFATGAVYAAGAYTAAILYTNVGVPFLISALIGAAAAAVMSLIVTLSAYKVAGLYLSLLSFGLVEVTSQILQQLEITGGAAGFRMEKWIMFGVEVSMTAKYYIVFAILVIAFLLQKHLRGSLWGRDFIAMKDDEVAASGVGINFRIYRVIGFAISSAIVGLGGALYAAYASYISPESFNFGLSIMVLLMVITGGSGTITGPVVGAIIITVVPEFFNTNPEFKNIFYGVMLIVITQLMPSGIVGLVKKKFKEIDYNRYIRVVKVDPEQVDYSKYVAHRANAAEDVLVVKNLTRQFGGLTAVKDLNMTVKRGTIHALIGPNGAGKTTAVNNITGFDTPTSGEVWFNGEEVTHMPNYERVKKGMSRTYQHVRMFRTLSVIDNVASGARLDKHYGLLDSIFQTRKKHRLDRETYVEALECLELLGIAGKANDKPDDMSSGQQKLMEIGRALIAKPDLLLLDEPCAGLTESETAQFAEMMKRIRSTGISILLIEHHMNLVMDVSDWITVIDHGQKIAEGKPQDVANDAIVRTAYLGE